MQCWTLGKNFEYLKAPYLGAEAWYIKSSYDGTTMILYIPQQRDQPPNRKREHADMCYVVMSFLRGQEIGPVERTTRGG